MKKVRGIFCINSRCKHYFEDNCMLIFETDTVHISKSGTCCDFELRQHEGYRAGEMPDAKGKEFLHLQGGA